MTGTLIGWLQTLIGSWSPPAGYDIDWTWLAGALMLLLLTWGAIRLVLALFHLIGGRK